ncbi:condensation domain-containing protein [Streptomyces sp. NPDC091272]|uniref:condensation domain-containing protein n=1 Tax=Streptomyces sp. NPDC091272 TaxID=3365981 RepID=UPI0038285149
MTADHIPSGDELIVVVDLTGLTGLPGKAEEALPVLELYGPLDTHRLEAALDRVDRATLRPTRAPLWLHRLEEHGPGRHTLRLTAAGEPDTPVDFPAGLLAGLLTHTPSHEPAGRRLVPSPLQRELIADTDAHPGTGRHSEQLAFTWSGPLDVDRFTAAWQSVFDHESVLRTAFEDGPQPYLVQRDRLTPDVVRLSYATTDWPAAVEKDHHRGIDPRTDGPLRITVLTGAPPEGPAAPAADAGPAAPAHILLTFHHTLLDGWSVRTLLREFYRAYLADGVLPGGERRPDLGDYLRWLTDQDTAPAQEFWAGADLAPGTDLPGTHLPAATSTGRGPRPGARRKGDGSGRTRTRLTTGQAERLYEWAAGLGSPESSVLHAVWALLLYRARGSEGPTRIRFHATVSGRGIPLSGVEQLPAPLRNPLPVTVDVDPRATLPALLDALRDQAVERSAYEWVTAGQARAWAGLRGIPATGSLLVFENQRYEDDALTRLLAEQGVHIGSAETLGARTAYPLTLIAQHTDDGALTLTASYDPARLAGVEQLLAHTAHLLRRIPAEADRNTTVGHLLELLAGLPEEPPPAPGRTVAGAYAEDAAAPPLVVLRPATSPGAGTVCLVQTPAARRSTHTRLVRAYRGPEAVALLRPAEVSRLRDAVLRVLAEGPVVLGGFSGAGVIAYEVARAVAAFGARAPLVVLTGAETPAADFVRTLEDMVRRVR